MATYRFGTAAQALSPSRMPRCPCLAAHASLPMPRETTPARVSIGEIAKLTGVSRNTSKKQFRQGRRPLDRVRADLIGRKHKASVSWPVPRRWFFGRSRRRGHGIDASCSHPASHVPMSRFRATPAIGAEKCHLMALVHRAVDRSEDRNAADSEEATSHIGEPSPW